MGQRSVLSLPRCGRSTRRTQSDPKISEQRMHLFGKFSFPECVPIRDRHSHLGAGKRIATQGFSASDQKGVRQSKIRRFYTYDEGMSELPSDQRNLSCLAE